MTGRQDAVARLWADHLAAPFPPGLRGAVVGGIDPVLLDADVAGCVVSWLHGGAADEDWSARLHQLGRDLDAVLPLLAGPERAYLARVRELAALVLAAGLSGEPTPGR